MDRITCKLPEPVAAELIERGLAQPILTDRGPALDIFLNVLGPTADFVIIVPGKDVITEMVRSLFRTRRAEPEADKRIVIKIGDDFELRYDMPEDVSLDGAAITEIVDAVMGQLPGPGPA